MLKEFNPDKKVILGGPHPTIFPEETAALDYVDFAFAGEGEERLISFLNSFNNVQEYKKIPGIAFELQGNIQYKSGVSMLSNLDNIKFPARKSSEYKKYISVIGQRSPITIMLTSRGCPYNCIFCNRMGADFQRERIEETKRSNTIAPRSR